MLIFVLEEVEQYEQHVVSGVFTDKAKAVEAFLNAHRLPRNSQGFRPSIWMLSSWEDGKKRKELLFYSDSESYLKKEGKTGKPIHEYGTRWGEFTVVDDPLSFAW